MLPLHHGGSLRPHHPTRARSRGITIGPFIRVDLPPGTVEAESRSCRPWRVPEKIDVPVTSTQSASGAVDVINADVHETTSVTERPTVRSAAKPIVDGERGIAAQIAVYGFSLVPLLAVVLAIPFAWGWGLGWTDLGIAAVFYVVSGMGITVGFHRYFTHGSFKANRPLKIALAGAGQMAAQGPVIIWVADHRRHHAFSDREGDPHSPWLYGTSVAALARGFWHAHMGWIFDRDSTNQQRFAPDLLTDKDIARQSKYFWVWTLASIFGRRSPAA